MTIHQTSGRFQIVIEEQGVIREDELAAELIGRDLPHGRYTIEPYVAWLIADSVESPTLPDGLAHPMFTYFAAQGGIAITLVELFAMAHATADDGIMLGTAELDIRRPLEIGQRFSVTGQIERVDRKNGSSGMFDVVGYRLDLLDEDDGSACASLSLGFIYPRRSSE